MGAINSKDVFKLTSPRTIEKHFQFGSSNSLRYKKNSTDNQIDAERLRLKSSRSMRKPSMFSYDKDHVRAMSHSDGLLVVRKKSAWKAVSTLNLKEKSLDPLTNEKSCSSPTKKRKQANIPFLPQFQSEMTRFLSNTRRKAHEEVTKNNQGKNYLLRYAVRRMDIDRVKKILSASDMNINDANDRGITVLHEAAIDGNCTCVKILVEHGADLNQTDNEGFNALDYAVCGGDFECASFLIKNGASECRIRNGLIGFRN